MDRKKILKTFLTISIILTTFGITHTVNAANNMAFSAGKGYGNVDMSATTISSYTYYGKMGYDSRYLTSQATRSGLAASFSNGTKRLESDIVFLTGHGMWNSIDTTASGGLKIGSGDNSKYVGTNNITWNRVKLAIFLACETGQETSNTDINLAYNVFKKSNWTTTSIGWHQEIWDTAASAWMDNFNSRLASGYSVSSALNYANSQSYSDNRVKDLAFYGNQSLVLSSQNVVMRQNELETQEQAETCENNITYVNEDVHFDGTTETLDNVVELIKQKDKNFNVEDYEVNIFKLSNEYQYYTIELTRKIDDIYTDSAYTIIVNNNKVVQIANNTVDFDELKLDKNFEGVNVNVAKEVATSKVYEKSIKECIDNNEKLVPIEIKKQNIQKYINLKNGKKYIRVLTTYGSEETETIAVSGFDYEI